MMTDPIADMLSRIRNGLQAGHDRIEVPASKLKVEIARILKSEGFISNYKLQDGDHQGVLRRGALVRERAGGGVGGHDEVHCHPCAGISRAYRTIRCDAASSRAGEGRAAARRWKGADAEPPLSPPRQRPARPGQGRG